MNILLTVEAIYDVADISDYIADEFGEDRAIQFEVDIEHRFETLDRYTHVGTGIYYDGSMIYKDVFSPSLIFFVIMQDEIHVLRVLREEQEWGKRLKEKQGYSYP